MSFNKGLRSRPERLEAKCSEQIDFEVFWDHNRISHTYSVLKITLSAVFNVT